MVFCATNDMFECDDPSCGSYDPVQEPFSMEGMDFLSQGSQIVLAPLVEVGLREKVRLLPDEQGVFDAAIDVLNDLNPSRRLSEFLRANHITPFVACHLLLAIGSRQLFLRDEAIVLLMGCCEKKLVEECAVQMFRDGCYPPIIERLVLLFFQKYQTPLSESVAFELYSIAQGSDARLGMSPVEGEALIGNKLMDVVGLSEAQRVFLFYARKIVRLDLSNSNTISASMGAWLETFVFEASNITLDDHLRLDFEWAQLQKEGVVIHDGQCTAFRDGSWTCEERSAVGLKESILRTRQEIAQKFAIARDRASSAFARARFIASVVNFDAIRREIGVFQTVLPIDFFERDVRADIERMASLALSFGKSVRKKITSPILQLRRKNAPPIPSSAVLKVCPADQSEPIVTISFLMGEGSYKSVSRVFRLAGNDIIYRSPPVYAYAKYKMLQRVAQDVRLIQRQIIEYRDRGELSQEIRVRERSIQVAGRADSIQSGIRQEVALSAEVGEDSAVPMQVVYKRSDPLVIKGVIMESMGGCLPRAGLERFSFMSRVRIAHRLCTLVADMHAKNIVHLDLKPDNFLCTKIGSKIGIKIIDFGTSKKITGNEWFSARVSTWTPPETSQGSRPRRLLSPSMDAWALGLTLLNLLYGDRARMRVVCSDGVSKPVDVVKQFFSDFQWGNHAVGAAIQGLLDYCPETRWSSLQAAQQLGQVLRGQPGNGLKIIIP